MGQKSSCGCRCLMKCYASRPSCHSRRPTSPPPYPRLSVARMPLRVEVEPRWRRSLRTSREPYKQTSTCGLAPLPVSSQMREEDVLTEVRKRPRVGVQPQMVACMCQYRFSGKGFFEGLTHPSTMTAPAVIGTSRPRRGSKGSRTTSPRAALCGPTGPRKDGFWDERDRWVNGLRRLRDSDFPAGYPNVP